MAVGEPVEGTILTVARAAAFGARGAAGAGAGVEAVAVAAVIAARAELARTAEVLAEAKAAGVVDAGAAGLLLQLEMLAETVAGPEALAAIDEVEWEIRERTGGLTPAESAAADEHPRGGGAYEVMFIAHTNRLIDAAGERSLKKSLRGVGDSVAVTGVEGMWQAHVHTDHPDKAIQVARAVAATQIVVRDVSGAGCDAAVGIVAMTTCPGLASALAGAGAAVLVALDPHLVSPSDVERVVADAGTDRVVVVAGASSLAAAARTLAARGEEPSVVVLDAESEPQVIAALVAAALASPGEDPDVAMRVAVACCTGEESSVASIVSDLERLITPDTDVATIILGAGLKASLADEAVRSLGIVAPEVDVHVYVGGQAAPAVIIGVETAASA